MGKNPIAERGRLLQPQHLHDPAEQQRGDGVDAGGRLASRQHGLATGSGPADRPQGQVPGGQGGRRAGLGRH